MRSLLVVTGAGVSAASGLPTFRGSNPDAVWGGQAEELGTLAYFERNPLNSWRWHTALLTSVLEARPNAAHLALAELERRWRGAFLLVTQNIDCLHEWAGSRALVKVHGTAARVRCTRRGCLNGAPHGSLALDLPRIRECLDHGALPRCELCRKPLRPHVLWFDERYDGHDEYQIERVDRFSSAAETYVFVGTSFSVGITDMLANRSANVGARTIVLDPDPSRAPTHAELRVGAAAPQLDGLVAELLTGVEKT